MSTAGNRFLEAAQILGSVRENELADLAYSILERAEPQAGLYGGSKLDRIRSWISDRLIEASRRAGQAGAEVLQILNEDRTRGDIHLAAILAAHLPHVLGIEVGPVEEVVALSLLILRLYEPPRPTE